MYNILICDDEKDIVRALKIYLTNPDYQMFEAYNGEEALEIVKREEGHDPASVVYDAIKKTRECDADVLIVAVQGALFSA